MADDFYPQEITTEEVALGFQRLLIDGIGDLRESLIDIVPVPVVAKILDSSDVLIKQFNCDRKDIEYAHRRWGRNQENTNLEHREWYLIIVKRDAKQLINDFKKEDDVPNHVPKEIKEAYQMYHNSIIGFPFRYRSA